MSGTKHTTAGYAGTGYRGYTLRMTIVSQVCESD